MFLNHNNSNTYGAFNLANEGNCIVFYPTTYVSESTPSRLGRTAGWLAVRGNNHPRSAPWKCA
eukprot:9037850-Pyramimonas_sp.AAC.1